MKPSGNEASLTERQAIRLPLPSFMAGWNFFLYE